MEINEQQLKDKIQGKILVMFHFSEGCKWCNRMKEPFEIYPSDVEKATFSFGPFDRTAVKPPLAEQLKIQSLPAFILFENSGGKPIPRDEILYQAFLKKAKIEESEIIINDPADLSQCDSCQ